jgi:hypothetical protein
MCCKKAGLLCFGSKGVFGVRDCRISSRFVSRQSIAHQVSVNQLVLDGKAGEFGNVAEVELLQQPLQVCIHCLCAYAVGFGDFLVGVPQGQPSENLQLPV